MLKRSVFANRKDHLLFCWRLQHKASPRKSEKEPKVAPDVVKFIDSSPEYQQLKDSLPKSLLRKYKNPESMYLIDTHTAKHITQAIKKHLDNVSPVIEVNPGLGILTRELLQNQKNCIYAYETLNHFTPHLQVSKYYFTDHALCTICKNKPNFSRPLCS